MLIRMIPDFDQNLAAAMAQIKGGLPAQNGSFHRDCAAKVVTLGAAVDAAIAMDRQEADGFWFNVLKTAKATVDVLTQQATFDQRVSQNVNAAQRLMDEVRDVVETSVRRHERVPEDLEADAAVWGDKAREVAQIQSEASALKAVPGWHGRSYDNYATAADVQVNALGELGGIFTSAQAGCEKGALFNRATFFLIGNDISTATDEIKAARGASGGLYYKRTSQAIVSLSMLLINLYSALGGEYTRGGTRQLSDLMRKSVAMPNILPQGAWPTGTSAAGQSAADTASSAPTNVDVPTTGGVGAGAADTGERL